MGPIGRHERPARATHRPAQQNNEPRKNSAHDALDNHPAVLVDVRPRIGISKAIDLPWRFGERGARCLSKPFGQPLARPVSEE